MSQKPFVKREIELRKGARAPWFEVKVTDKEGKEHKFIMKPVKEFWSEKESDIPDQ